MEESFLVDRGNVLDTIVLGVCLATLLILIVR